MRHHPTTALTQCSCKESILPDTAPKLSGVQLQSKLLGEAIDQLHVRLGKLEDRLSQVLIAGTEPNDVPANPPCTSGMAVLIRDHADKVRGAVDRLEQLMDRIDL